MPYSGYDDPRWRIKEFAARTGVPEVTLRAWERRYDLLAPARSPNGYRLYGPTDERRVIAMQAHLERGVSAAQAAELARSERDLPADVPTDPAALRTRLLAAVERFDAHEVDAMVLGAFALGATDAVVTVILPVLRAIGSSWERGVLTVGHEHFATHLIERRLLEYAARWNEGGDRLALLACPSGERHTLGLMCFGIVLSERGWRVAFLGADTPITHIRQAADALAPASIVVSAVDKAPFLDGATDLRSLGEAHRLVIGGAGATESVARRLRAARAPDDPLAAAEALEQA